jgi:hypothetical protein
MNRLGNGRRVLNSEWLSIEECAIALGVGRRRTLMLAKSEQWRKEPGRRPARYALEDVTRTWEARQ